MHASPANPAARLGEERDAAHNLLQLLEQEQAHLVDADVDGLSRLTEEKAKTAAQMSELAKHRHGLLEAAGFALSESGMQAWLNSPAATAADRQSWTELLELAQSAKEQNRLNGLLITQHMARNQSALNILQGNSQSGAIYGPNGQSATKINSRRLVVG
jgi:flagella synthesis protein FlgN